MSTAVQRSPRDHSVEASDDEDADELNIIDSNLASGSATNKRVSLRLRESKASPSVSNGGAKKEPRKRTLSTSVIADQPKAKRQRLDDKKAVSVFRSHLLSPLLKTKKDTEASSAKKDTRDAARKRWYYQHREILRPLLPPNSTFISTLEREISQSTVLYQPRREIDEQPELIRGGQMKDYQVWVTSTTK